MIRCTNCNTINTPEALFCSNCNAFLEWNGVKVSAAEIAAAEKAAAEKAAAEKAEAERVAAEKAAAEKAEAERVAAEKAAAEKAEAERVAAEKAEAERVAAEKAAAERLAAEKAAAEKAEAERLAAEKAAAEKAEAERLAAEKAAAEKAEAERVAAEKAAAERLAAEKAEAERVAAEKAEAERVAAENAEAEKVAAEKAEADKVAAEKAAAEKAEADKVAAEAAEKEAADKAAAELLADTEPEPAPQPKPESRFRAKPKPKPEPEPEPEPHETWTPPPPPPPPPPFIPDTQPIVEKPPEPEKIDYRFRAPARKPEAAAAVPQPKPADSGRPPVVAAAAVTAAVAQPPAAKPAEPPAQKPQPAQPQPRQPAAEPEARKPAPEIKRRSVQAPPRQAGEPEYKPGDLICGKCGAGNDPTRRFCRKCGTNLVDAVVVAPPSWFRRTFRRNDKAIMAGERPKWMGDADRRGGMTATLNRFFRLRRLVLGMLIAGAAIGVLSYAFVPGLKGTIDHGIDNVRRTIMPSYGPIAPHDYTASEPPVEGHPEELAFDAGSNTYWAASSNPTLALTVTFDHPFDLGAILLSTAPVLTRTDFDRPKTVELSFPGTDNKSVTLTLADTDQQIQNGGLDARGVTQVVLTFKDYYAAAAGGQNVLAMTDIQFQYRR